MNIVKITWLDAGFENTNMHLEQVKCMTPMLRENVGYLIMNNKKQVILSFGFIHDKEHGHEVWDGTLVIPKGMIVKIEQLKEE